MKIGFFDSGIGGLTIMRAVREAMPQYDYLFYGDTAHLPYGNKTEAEIFELTKQAMEYLFEHGTVLNIVACNTASAETLRKLQDTWLPAHYPDRKILGVVIPTIETILDLRAKNVLLIGTNRTIDSGKYPIELEKRDVLDVVLTMLATPELVPLIEAGLLNEAFNTFERLTSPYTNQIDALVLGCTHYTMLKTHIRAKYPEAYAVISQDEVIPHKLSTYLKHHPEIETRLTRNGAVTTYLTLDREAYRSGPFWDLVK